MTKKKHTLRCTLLVALAAAVLLAGAAGFYILDRYAIVLTLNGPAELTLEYGDSYTDAGVCVGYRGLPLLKELSEADVAVEGTVTTDRTGTYPITYTVEKELDLLLWHKVYEASITRTVQVVDTTPPRITLLTDPAAYTLPGSEYQEEGYLAEDACDGDLTQQVLRRVDGDTVYYQVTDAAGNTAEVTRQILYSDPVAPELTLRGSLRTGVLLGDAYEEPGYQALDNLDGDITHQVTVSGTVDTETMGDYVLEYRVTDAHGNVTTAVRTVNVRDYPALPEDLFPGQGKPPVSVGEKVVYLTFDDGPTEHTDELLAILKKYDVKATFFVMNRGKSDLLKRIAEDGHTLAMHCGVHSYQKIYASEEAYFADLKEIQDAIYEATGQISTIVRFPGGSSNTASDFNKGIMTRLSKMLDEMNYRYFDWNVSAADCSRSLNERQVYSMVVGGIQQNPVSVVLQHDTKLFSVNAVEDIIQWGLENGYTFLPLGNDSPECRHRINN